MGINARNIDYIARYNDRSAYSLVDNKLLTKKAAQKFKLPVPKLLSSITSQHQIKHSRDWLGPTSGFAIKPAKGSGGKGILVISRHDGQSFYKASNKRLEFEDLQRHVSNILAGLFSLGGSSDDAIVEELVQMDPMFEGYSHEGIPDIRIIVFQGYPVMAMLRLSTHRSDGKANLHQGALGVGIDLQTGQCLDAIYDNTRVYHHPDTHKELYDIKIPQWQKLLLMAAQCYEMSGLGYMGVDIVLDARHGPLILELNARPGLSIQVANAAGLKPRLQKIQKYKKSYPYFEHANQRVKKVHQLFE